jgi:hypothetical protein
VERANHAEALRLMSAYLLMDRLQDHRDDAIAEICIDLWVV